MPRCIVHMGPHKTGTSSIQATLFNDLDDPAFEYARLGRANHGSLIQAIFAGTDRSLDFHSARARSTAEIEAFVRRAMAALDSAMLLMAAPTIIISGELISLMSEDEIEEFDRDLAPAS